MQTMMCGLWTYGYRMGSLSTTTCALHAEPRASGPNACVRQECFPSNSAAAFPMMMPPRMTPWPPRPPTLISVGPMLSVSFLRPRRHLAGLLVRNVLLAERLAHPLLHRLLERRTLAV